MKRYSVDAFTFETHQMTHTPGFPENSWNHDEIEEVLQDVRNILENSISGIYCIQIFDKNEEK